MPPVVQQQIESFFTKYRPKEYTKGEIVIFPGDPPVGMYYLSKGTVRQYDISKRGVDLVVNIFTPLAMFPVSSTLKSYANEYFFNAATPVTLRRAPMEEFLEFIRLNNDVALELLARAQRRLDIVTRRQTLLMSSDASSRLAYEIALSCHSFGELHDDGTYTVRLNETELAARVGLARETVSRQMHELKSKKIIQITSEHISVLNLKLLESSLVGGP